MVTIYNIAELQALIERQRIIIEAYDKTAEFIFENGLLQGKAFENIDAINMLRGAYDDSQNTHTMTGASEK